MVTSPSAPLEPPLQRQTDGTWRWLSAWGLVEFEGDGAERKPVAIAGASDAYGLAQIVKAGWYKGVGVKSLDSHAIRSMLDARAQLVGMRVEVTNQISGILKTFGIVLSRRTGEPFERLVGAACDDSDSMLNRTVRSLLCVYSCLKEQIRHLDRQLMGRARKSAVCQQLITIPGVGVLTALAFVTAVDDPAKFTVAADSGAAASAASCCSTGAGRRFRFSDIRGAAIDGARAVWSYRVAAHRRRRDRQWQGGDDPTQTPVFLCC